MNRRERRQRFRELLQNCLAVIKTHIITRLNNPKELLMAYTDLWTVSRARAAREGSYSLKKHQEEWLEHPLQEYLGELPFPSDTEDAPNLSGSEWERFWIWKTSRYPGAYGKPLSEWVQMWRRDEKKTSTSRQDNSSGDPPPKTRTRGPERRAYSPDRKPKGSSGT